MAMQFEKIGEGAYSLDVCGYTCPHPQMYTKKSLEKMDEDEVLTVLFDNPSSRETMLQMVDAAGHEILEDTKKDGKLILKIEKC